MYKFYHFITGLFWTLLDFRFQLIFTVWLRAKMKQKNFSGTIEINLYFIFVSSLTNTVVNTCISHIIKQNIHHCYGISLISSKNNGIGYLPLNFQCVVMKCAFTKYQYLCYMRAAKEKSAGGTKETGIHRYSVRLSFKWHHQKRVENLLCTIFLESLLSLERESFQHFIMQICKHPKKLKMCKSPYTKTL